MKNFGEQFPTADTPEKLEGKEEQEDEKIELESPTISPKPEIDQESLKAITERDQERLKALRVEMGLLSEETQEKEGDDTNPDDELGTIFQRKMPRRDFLKEMAAIAFGPSIAKEALGKTTELETEKESFADKWSRVLEEGIQRLKNNQEIINQIGEEGIEELVEILRGLDIKEYIDSLAKVSGIDKKDINGKIQSFDVLSGKENSRMAEVEGENLRLFLEEWAKFEGKFDAPTIQAVLEHEWLHIFSFDEKEEGIPWLTRRIEDINNSVIVLRSFYEGATEAIAIQARLMKKDGTPNLEQGYRGGEALSAFAISELIGSENFAQAYLKKDPELLGKFLNQKYGPGGHFLLHMPAVINILGDTGESLNYLHRIFTERKHFNINVEEILTKAWNSGIKEKANQFEMENNALLTTHLFQLNDADQPPRYVLNGLGEGPEIYRYGKPMERYKITDEAGVEHWEEVPYLEGINIIIMHQKSSAEEQEKCINTAVESLKERCSQPAVEERLADKAFLIIGLDDHTEELLNQLNKLDPKSDDFTKLWDEINQYTQEKTQEYIRQVLEKAELSDLVFPGFEKE